MRTAEERHAATLRAEKNAEQYDERVDATMADALKRPEVRFLLAWIIYDLCGLEQVEITDNIAAISAHSGRRSVAQDLYERASNAHPEMFRRLMAERLRELEKENVERDDD